MCVGYYMLVVINHPVGNNMSYLILDKTVDPNEHNSRHARFTLYLDHPNSHTD